MLFLSEEGWAVVPSVACQDSGRAGISAHRSFSLVSFCVPASRQTNRAPMARLGVWQADTAPQPATRALSQPPLLGSPQNMRPPSVFVASGPNPTTVQRWDSRIRSLLPQTVFSEQWCVV